MMQSEDAVAIASRTEQLVADGHRQDKYEVPFRDVLRVAPAGRFGVADITGHPWTEIDFPEDLEYARNDVFPSLAPLPSAIGAVSPASSR